MTEADGRPAQPRRNQFRLGSSVEQLGRWRGRPLLALECLREAFQDERLPHVLDRPRAATHRLTELRVNPRWPVGVGLPQERRSPPLLRLAR